MDMILKNTFQSISPAYELIGDVTVGSNTTQVDFAGLNIGKDDELLLVSDVIAVNTGYLSFYVSGNTTATNYYQQQIYASLSTIGAGRSNIASAIGVYSGNRTLGIAKLKLTNSGYSVYQSENAYRYATSSLEIGDYCGTSTFTASSLTSVSIVGSSANIIGTGSRFQLYKLVAEKVADIIVPSNTTSVDITGLNIGKDGEYYLVSDVVNSSGSTSGYRLFYNNNTTVTNYYQQYLIASGTTTNAGRVNETTLVYIPTGYRTSANTDIKLTNSGYMVHQNNETRYYGGSMVELTKSYNASTFTASAITQLTITASVTNGIGANSRFTLYKMK